MTDQTPVTFPWRTDFENAPSPCIGWCTPPAGDDVRQIWRHSHLKGQWTAHSITQTVKAWQPLPSIGIDGGVAQQLSLTDAMVEAGARVAGLRRGHKNCDELVTTTNAGKQPVWKFYTEEPRAILEAVFNAAPPSNQGASK